MVSSTGCMKVCDSGPVVIVYPQNTWYKTVNEEVADVILDDIENGTVTKEYVLA